MWSPLSAVYTLRNSPPLYRKSWGLSRKKPEGGKPLAVGRVLSLSIHHQIGRNGFIFILAKIECADVEGFVIKFNIFFLRLLRVDSFCFLFDLCFDFCLQCRIVFNCRSCVIPPSQRDVKGDWPFPST